jgi:hypothetical protein
MCGGLRRPAFMDGGFMLGGFMLGGFINGGPTWAADGPVPAPAPAAIGPASTAPPSRNRKRGMRFLYYGIVGYRSWPTSVRNLWQCGLSFVLFCWKHCRMIMSPCPRSFLQRRDASAEQALFHGASSSPGFLRSGYIKRGSPVFLTLYLKPSRPNHHQQDVRMRQLRLHALIKMDPGRNGLNVEEYLAVGAELLL